MQDRPSANDLLEAIADFLIKEIYPAVKENDLLMYKTLVSWNMLGVLAREQKLQDEILQQELTELSALLKKDIPQEFQNSASIKSLLQTWQEELAHKIRSEKIFDTNSSEWSYVRESLKRKLSVANPRFSLTEEPDRT